MNAATSSTRRFGRTRLLALDAKQQSTEHLYLEDILQLLNPGDLIVFNNSSTLPASLKGRIERSGEKLEIRLASFMGRALNDWSHWKAISFDYGTWKTPTESRKAPPLLRTGDRIYFSAQFSALVLNVRPQRILDLQLISANPIKDIYSHGHPIQYSYLKEPLNIWDSQTLFSGPPLSVEPPSSGINLNWQLIAQLREKGIVMVGLSHGAGLSSTGNHTLDLQLPLEETFNIPVSTLNMIQQTKDNHGHVIALGTTVIRALETTFSNPIPKWGLQRTTLKINEFYKRKVVDKIITGMHELGTSHREILNSFTNKTHLEKAYKEALDLEYLNHEFGDLCLVG